MWTGKVIIVNILIVFSTITYGQSIDSLENSLRTSLSDEERVNVLNVLSRELNFVNQQRSSQLAKEALEIAIKINYKYGEAYALRNLSGYYFDNDILYLSTKYLRRAQTLFNELKDSAGIANCYIILGHINRKLKNRNLELSYHKKSDDLFKLLGNKRRIGVTTHNVGESYFNNGDYVMAREYTNQAIHLNDSLQQLQVLSSCYKVMGHIEYAEGKYSEAEINYKKTLEISEKLGEQSQKIATIEAMIGLINVYKAIQATEKEILQLKAAKLFCKQNTLPEFLKEIDLKLVQFYLLQNNHQAATYYLNKLDSTIHLESTTKLQNWELFMKETQYVYDVEFQNQLLLKEHNFTSKLKTYGGIALVVLTVLLIALGLALSAASRNNKIIKRRNVKLAGQTKIIETQRDKLEALNQTKNRFFTIVAHDLKSPFISLRDYSSLLSNHIDTISREELLMISKELFKTFERTVKLSENLIMWARLQMNEFESNPKLLVTNNVLHDVVDFFENYAKAKEIKIHVSVTGTPHVYADVDQFSLIVRNLINNAIKFSYKGSVIQITVSSVDTQTTEIVIADSGTGMSQAIQQNLMQMDKKVTLAGTNNEMGTGLGLVLCSEFIKLNNGTLRFESVEGKGTTFYIQLPAIKRI